MQIPMPLKFHSPIDWLKRKTKQYDISNYMLWSLPEQGDIILKTKKTKLTCRYSVVEKVN